MLTVAAIRAVLIYDPETGLFIRRDSGRRFGGYHGDGRMYGQLGRQKYALHRLAWFYMTGRWPVAEVDHADGAKDNNRWANLREATRAQNERNKGLPRNSTSGLKGASWHKRDRRWRSFIKMNGKQISLGYHETAEQAHGAYCAAARNLHGEFSRIQ